MVAHEKTAKRVDAALERILEHAGLVAIAETVDALELELAALVTNRVADDAVIGRVAYEQRVAVRGHALGRGETVLVVRCALDHAQEHQVLVQYLF